MQNTDSLTVALLLLVAVNHLACVDASFERNWWSRSESLSDYEAVRSLIALSKIQCTAAASCDSAVQLVAFNASSGLCTHFRCRLGLSHCRKCRNLNKGAQRVWTASNDCWTTVQHRVSGSVDFYRNWSQYQSEFGEGPDGNYWIGLNWLREMTQFGSRKLRFLMKAWNESQSWAEYSNFSVGPKSDNYRLSVSGFSGSDGIGDSFAVTNDCQFTTKDADHDTSVENCAEIFHGAWWFSGCHNTHPNGEYKSLPDAIGGPFAQGIIWKRFYSYHYSLMEFEMLVL